MPNTNEPYHADTCTRRDKWLITYVSRDDNNHIIALEIVCEVHHIDWWFPPREIEVKQ